jgi:hypothetical protein
LGGEIHLAARDRLVGADHWCLDVADIGEALRAQQLVGEIQRGDADTRALVEPNGGRFEGALRSLRARRADDARGAGRCQRG